MRKVGGPAWLHGPSLKAVVAEDGSILRELTLDPARDYQLVAREMS